MWPRGCSSACPKYIYLFMSDVWLQISRYNKGGPRACYCPDSSRIWRVGQGLPAKSRWPTSPCSEHLWTSLNHLTTDAFDASNGGRCTCLSGSKWKRPLPTLTSCKTWLVKLCKKRTVRPTPNEINEYAQSWGTRAPKAHPEIWNQQLRGHQGHLTTRPWSTTHAFPENSYHTRSGDAKWCKMNASKCSLQEVIVRGKLIVTMLICQCLETRSAQTCPNPCQSQPTCRNCSWIPATPMDQKISSSSWRVLLLTSATVLHQERSNDLLSLDPDGGAVQSVAHSKLH